MNVPAFNRLLIGLTIFLSYTLFAISWKSSDMIITNLGFDANDLSSLVGIMNIVKVAANFLVGLVMAKFAQEKLFLKNAQLMMLGGLMVAASMFMMIAGESFAFLAVARAIQGIGGAFILFSMNPIVAETFTEKELPLVNGMNGSAFNIGIACMLSISALMTTHSEQIVQMLVIAGLAIVALFWFANRGSVRHMKQAMRSKGETQQSDGQSSEERFGMMDAFKSGFNWLFAVTFTGIMAFYYVAFTFLDAETVAYMLYAGIVGNFVGIAGAKVLKHTTVVRIASVASFALATGFMLTLGQPIVKFIAIALGFVMFFSLPSYLTLAFTQKGATPKRIGLTFMMLWVLSDLLATFILKIYAYLVSNPETNTASILFILGVKSMFLIGCFIFKAPKEEVKTEEEELEEPVVA